MSDERERTVDQVFDNPDSGSGSATHRLLGGVGLIAAAIVGFAVAIRTRHGQMELHLTTTLPALIGIGLLARGLMLRRIPDRIVVTPEALEVTTRRDTTRHLWSEVGSAATANVVNSSKGYLRITDPAGKTIVRVDESFPDYDRLVRSVESHIDAKADDTSARLMSRKAKRTALLSLVTGSFLAFAAIFVARTTHEDQRARELLARQGVAGEGEIVRRFVAPNGVTKRIEYRVAGSGLRNVEVHPLVWDQLEAARTVAVLYVPAEPDVSRLELGEVEDDEFTRTPGGGYLLAGLGGLLALFLLGFSPFAWRGYDLAHDKDRQTWKIKRHGRVIWASKAEPPG